MVQNRADDREGSDRNGLSVDSHRASGGRSDRKVRQNRRNGRVCCHSLQGGKTSGCWRVQVRRCPGAMQVRVLVGAEEEKLVFDYWSAESATESVVVVG